MSVNGAASLTRHKFKAVSLGLAWVLVVLLNIWFLPDKLALAVKIEKISAHPMDLTVEAPGKVQPALSMTFKAEFDGPILSKAYQEGDSIQAGQVLLEISRERFQIEYNEVMSRLANAEIDYDKARRNRDVQKQLYAKEAVARVSVEDAERQFSQADRTFQKEKLTAQAIEQRWTKNIITAPFSGRILQDFLENQNSVSAGKEILTLADISEYIVSARVNEFDIAQIKESQRAEVLVSAFPDNPLAATVLRIGSHAEGEGLPEVPVEMKLENPQGLALLPKFTARVRIIIGVTDPVMSVPLSAIYSEKGESYVWVLSNTNRIAPRKVVVGRSNSERAEIVEGLTLDERVCAAAEPSFRPNLKVRVNE